MATVANQRRRRTARKSETATAKKATAGKKMATVSATATGLSAKQAIQKVLKREGAPLATKVIVERVLATRGVSLKGATPAATIAAILSTENKKADGLFVRTDPGMYALRA